MLTYFWGMVTYLYWGMEAYVYWGDGSKSWVEGMIPPIPLDLHPGYHSQERKESSPAGWINIAAQFQDFLKQQSR